MSRGLFFTTYKSGIYHVIKINEYSHITWLALKIFAVIYCLEYVEIIIAWSDKSSKFNSFESTLVVFNTFSCLWCYKLFIDE